MARPIKWTLDKLISEANKYTTRNAFKLKSTGAYSIAWKRGILDTICEHMSPVHKNLFGALTFKTGIYFLYQGDKLVYIGKSNTDMTRRLGIHFNNTNKLFDSVVAYVINNDCDINVAELYLINKYKPKYNKNDIGTHTMTLNLDNSINSIINEEITIDLKGVNNG